MPRLLLFGPCANLIVDRDNESVSMISIMSGVKRSRPKEPLEPDAYTALDWANVAIWLRLPEDEGKTFEQRFQIILPDGLAFGDAIIRFQFTKRVQQNTIRGKIFPVGQLGELQLRVSIREVQEGMSKDEGWQVAMDYPIIAEETSTEEAEGVTDEDGDDQIEDLTPGDH